MVTIYRRGKVWYASYQADGRQIRRRVSTSKAVAEEYQRRIEAELDRRELGLPTSDKTQITFGEFYELFRCRYSQVHHAESTRKNLDVYARTYWLPAFGDRPVTVISATLLESYRAHRLTTVGPSSVNRELSALRKIFRAAVNWGYLHQSPMLHVKPQRTPDPELPDVLTEDEEARLLAHADGAMFPLLATALHAGLRWGELQNLVWGDVDFDAGDHGAVSIRAKAGWHPKSYHNRTIPMTAYLFGVLAEWRLRRDEPPAASECVFAEIPNKSKVWRWLRRIRRRAGLRYFTLHTLRHTFGTRLAEHGAPIHAVQRLMGHSKITTTQRYFHAMDAVLRGTMALREPQDPGGRAKMREAQGIWLGFPRHNEDAKAKIIDLRGRLSSRKHNGENEVGL